MEGVSDPIDVAVDLDIEITTNLELQLFFIESVDRPIHFQAIVGKMPTEEVKESISFSFDNGGKVRVNRSLHDIEVKKLEVIIPRKIFWGWLRFNVKWLVMWMLCQKKLRQHQWNQLKVLVYISR
ncbi:hypothetical protein PVK06_027894 [Gossypium arboreum]|uniref:Uncharacterized protein n=1 Tax=Gossypium arboreum TaxID=29729 RepID=A0ABR0P1G5_GOSAR|nr:hypothetical protein PVK06_027894 [Gossypium arboreum]